VYIFEMILLTQRERYPIDSAICRKLERIDARYRTQVLEYEPSIQEQSFLADMASDEPAIVFYGSCLAVTMALLIIRKYPGRIGYACPVTHKLFWIFDGAKDDGQVIPKKQYSPVEQHC